MSKKQVVVIGCGFSGLSAATHLATTSDCSVVIVEKHESAGGRARQLQHEGFMFDMGPSWYWMPDVFESYFARFGKRTSDYYELVRLDPSYAVVFGEDDILDIPADFGEFKTLFETLEPGSGVQLDRFLAEAKRKYEIGIQDVVYQPGLSVFEYFSLGLLTEVLRLDCCQSMSKHVRKFFSHHKIIRLLEFPVLFLGETAQNMPSLYSLLNYADIVLGTWYPKGGMHEIIKGMVTLAEEKGVQIRYASEVDCIEVEDFTAKGVRLVSGERLEADVVVASADYHHVDSHLLDTCYSNYSEMYWHTRVLAPSCLIFYLGVSKRLHNLRHHNLFFDEPLEPHADAIFENPRWPEKPLFYVSVPSISDSTVAPEGMENVFILIPLAPDLKDSEETREKYYHIVMERLEAVTKQEIRSSVCFKKSYGIDDFKRDYHSYKGNAYGLANTLLQTAVFKPTLRNRLVRNLYYTGQLTVPGPGVPPCLISGCVVATEVMKGL